MRIKFNKIFPGNLSIALLIFIPVFLITDPVDKKYKALQTDHEVLMQPDKIYFDDINFDGNSDRVEFYINKQGFIAVKLYDPSHRGQANSTLHAFDSEVRAIFGNFDGNSSKEIYISGERNDSLFINVLDYSQIGETQILSEFEEHFIYAIEPDADFGFGIMGLYDFDNDGYKEILLSLNAGYTLQPRILLTYNFITGQIVQTPFSGSKTRANFIKDINNDGFPEIVSGTFAYRNYVNIDVPYTDTCSWLMVYDNELNYLFDPVLLSKNKTDTQVFPVGNNGETLLLVVKERVYDAKAPVQFLVYSSKGKLIRELEMPVTSDYIKRRSPVVVITDSTKNEGVYYIDHLGNFFRLNKNFEFNKSHHLEELKYSRFVYNYDLDKNGKTEYLLKEVSSNDYYILDSELKNPVHIEIPNILGEKKRVGLRERKDQNSLLYFQVGTQIFYFSYFKNPLWDFRFFIWAAIFGAIYGLLWLLQFIQKERIKNQVETRQQIKELQFKVITSQLNPHFTFNALNAISSSVYDPENPELYDRFTTFSRLIRSILSDSDKITRSLHDELNFTRDFLKIQKLRFKEAFEYYFEIDEQVDQQIPVPKLIIQIYAENAIKHAFPNVFGEDKLVIRVTRENKNIKIEIEDNGIGRDQAKNKKHIPKNTGKGLLLMSDYISLLNKQNHQKIRISIVDLNENKSGTLIQILIPAHFKYKLK